MAIRLSQLLARIPSDTQERVDKARKRANGMIREALRRETGLLLNRQDKTADDRQSESISVPITLAPGLPESLQDFSFDDSYALVLEISPFRRFLGQSKAGLEGIRPLIGRLERLTSAQSVLKDRGESVASTYDLIVDLLAVVGTEEDPVTKLLEVNEDVLGVYRYRLPDPESIYPQDPFSGRIELYWGVIGLIAAMLGVSAEALTTVVLAHELAHAYTHVGADIDGERWASVAFAQSQHELKEGLAQYYTDLVCRRLDNQIPDALLAYSELLPRQPAAYRTHEEWVADFRPEEIRMAMLPVRRNGVGNVDGFDEALSDARERLRSHE